MDAYFPRFLPSDFQCGTRHQSFEGLGLSILLRKTFYLQVLLTKQFTSNHVINKRKYRSFRWNGKMELAEIVF